MLALLGISTIASLVASGVIGFRLLRLYGRTRQLPELIMGSAMLVAGVVGYVCMIVGAGASARLPAEIANGIFHLGYALISAGVILSYLFVWRVFRPRALVARVFMGIVCPVVAVTGLPMALPGVDEASGAPEGPVALVFWLGHLVRIGAGAWGAAEAGRYWLAMRRRMRLGLADAAVTNRIALWGCASLGGVVIFTSTALANAGGSSMGEVMNDAQILLISSVTLGVAICQWLAFLPPAAYLRWVVGRAPQAGQVG